MSVRNRTRRTPAGEPAAVALTGGGTDTGPSHTGFRCVVSAPEDRR